MEVYGRDDAVLGKLAVWSVVFIDLEKGPQGGRLVLSYDLDEKRVVVVGLSSSLIKTWEGEKEGTRKYLVGNVARWLWYCKE